MSYSGTMLAPAVSHRRLLTAIGRCGGSPVLDQPDRVWHTLTDVYRSRGSVHGKSGIGFGLLIAYVLPGFMLLAALSLVAPPLQLWLLGRADATPSVGGVLYVTAASILIGKLLNLFRWAALDTLHARMGVRRPVWDERLLPGRQQAFEMLVEQHYRYYQFYGNVFLALPLCLIAFRSSEISPLLAYGPLEGLLIVTEFALFYGSRDVLRRYYSRSALLFSDEGSAMTNGNHPKPKQNQKPEPSPKQSPEKPKQSAKK